MKQGVGSLSLLCRLSSWRRAGERKLFRRTLAQPVDYFPKLLEHRDLSRGLDYPRYKAVCRLVYALFDAGSAFYAAANSVAKQQGIRRVAEAKPGRFKRDAEAYLRRHPGELDSYISAVLDEYAETHDLGALLVSLRIASRIRGVTATSRAAGMTRNGLQKALRESSHPMFATVNAIMHALGYRFTVERKAAGHLGRGVEGGPEIRTAGKANSKQPRFRRGSRKAD